MKITENDIKKFQKLYKKYYGIQLSNNDARIKLARLVHQVGLIYRPITQEQVENLMRQDTKQGK